MVSVSIDPEKIREQIRLKFSQQWEAAPRYEPQAVPEKEEPAPKPTSPVAAFCAKFSTELEQCRIFYGLASKPDPKDISTYEGWAILRRQVKRGAKGFHFSREFAAGLVALNVFAQPINEQILAKCRYETVAMFCVACTEEKTDAPNAVRARRTGQRR